MPHLHTCEHCGKSFETKRAQHRRRYCSLDCSAQAKARQEERCCEACGQTFRTRQGSKQKYCSQDCYWESLRLERAIVYCSNCGSPFEKHAHKVTERNFCSVKCRDANGTGSKAVAINFTCTYCQTPFQRTLGRIARHDGNRFCSRECANTWNKANTPTGTAHPHYNRVQVLCATCGNTLTRPPYRLRDWEEQYCDQKCAGKARTRRFSEANHPNWKGGDLLGYRGPNWETQATAARKRDGYRCQACGISQKKIGRRLDVHHIISFRDFGYIPGENDNYIQANQLTNLTSLCPSCHQLAEGNKISIQLPLV